MSNKRAEKVTVIPPDDVEVIEPGQVIAQREPEREVMTSPHPTLDLELINSQDAVERVLAMPAQQALDFLDSQILAAVMLLNEEILRWVAVLQSSKDKRERAEAAVHLNNCMNISTKMTESKIKLMQAIGADKLAKLTQAAEAGGPTPAAEGRPKLYTKTEVSEEDFTKQFGHLVPGGGEPAQA